MAEIKGNIPSSRKDFIDLFTEHKNILSDFALRINCSWFVQQMARFILDEVEKRPLEQIRGLVQKVWESEKADSGGRSLYSIPLTEIQKICDEDEV